MLIRRFILLCGLLVLGACSLTAREPAWLQDPHANYPASTHLAAVGQGSSRALAADRALANLAKQFTVALQEVSSDLTESVSSPLGVQAQQQISRELQTQTKDQLEGAQVMEYWDTEGGEVYALAVLDKAQASQRLRQDILRNDREIDALLRHANTTADNPVAALNALRQALLLSYTRDAQARKLMVTSGQGLATPHPSDSIESTLRNALATLKVGVDASDNGLRAALEDALTQLGVGLESNATLRLLADMDTAPPYEDGGWYWLRGAYQMTLSQGARTLSQVRKPLKISARDPNLLQQRARDEMQNTLPAAVVELFTQTTP